MRTIGLLGGMSWESTAEYYRLANELVRQRLGGAHSARIVLVSVDFAEIARLQHAGQWQQAARLLARHAMQLQAAGADVLVLCTNTMHKVAGEIEAVLSIPFLHLADTTADAVRRAGLRRVGLLGTAFTMEQDFYRDRLAGTEFEVLVPEADDRAEVHRIIYEELIRGEIRAESRAVYQAVIDRLVARGAQGVVLGCTEIELLIAAEHAAVPVFPTTRLHVEAAVDFALAELIRLDHVVIAVSDWDRAIAFYRDVLGAEVVDHPDGRVAFRFGGQQLNVHGPGLDYSNYVAAKPVTPGNSDLCFVWPGTLDELTTRLAEHRVPMEAEPITRHGASGRGTSVYFRDPDGSLMEFIVYG